MWLKNPLFFQDVFLYKDRNRDYICNYLENATCLSEKRLKKMLWNIYKRKQSKDLHARKIPLLSEILVH